MEGAHRTGIRRLHSISGVVPIGVFLALHFWTNAAAVRGADAYNAAARRLQELPLLVGLEILLIALPIFFHGIYGFYISAAESTSGEGRTPARRALSVFQRATGVATFVFVLFHLWTTRLVQIQDHGALDLFHLMQASLASPWIRASYWVGTLSATGHLSAGIWTFSEAWGLLPGGRGRYAVAAAAAAAFVLLSGLGLRSLSGFRLPL